QQNFRGPRSIHCCWPSSIFRDLSTRIIAPGTPSVPYEFFRIESIKILSNGADTDNTLWNQPEGPGLMLISLTRRKSWCCRPMRRIELRAPLRFPLLDHMGLILTLSDAACSVPVTPSSW